MIKTYKVVFVGRKRNSTVNYSKQTVTIGLNKRPTEITGVLPELNKGYEVYELLEIWELIF